MANITYKEGQDPIKETESSDIQEVYITKAIVRLIHRDFVYQIPVPGLKKAIDMFLESLPGERISFPFNRQK